MTIRDRALAVIRQHLPCDPAAITDDATLADLGADSLDTIEISFALEEEFGINIEDDELDGLVTVGDCLRALERRLENTAC